MEPADRIAELERRISDNTAWRIAWTNGLGTRDPAEFHRRGDEILADTQELETIRATMAPEHH